MIEINKKIQGVSNHIRSQRSHVGFLHLLTLLLIGLKLTGHIAWSWIWVFAPLWVPIAIALMFLVLVFAAVYIKLQRESKKDGSGGSSEM